MSNLSNSEVKKIAEALAPMLVNEVRKDHHSFYIDSETHYQDHMDWRQWRGNLNSAQKIFWTAFIGLVVVGSFVLAAFGVFKFNP